LTIEVCTASGPTLGLQTEIHDPQRQAIVFPRTQQSWDNQHRAACDLQQTVCDAAEEQASQSSVFDIAEDDKVSVDCPSGPRNRMSWAPSDDLT
jgi:hypothetical protein